MAERVVDELRPVLVRLRVDAALGEPRAQLVLIARPQLEPLERLDEADPLPRRFRSISCPRNVTFVPSASSGDPLEHRLDALHRVAVVGVRLVPLEHRELGLVLVRDALVAEVLADLVDALEAAHDQPLEVELGRDAEVEVGFELVRVRDERVGERAAVARLEHGRLDLDEALLVEVAADRR